MTLPDLTLEGLKVEARQRVLKTYSGNDLGDFQTPPLLVNAILKALPAQERTYSRVLEPTCGTGNFVFALLDQPEPPAEIHAIEVQHGYVQQVLEKLPRYTATRVIVQETNLFDIDLQSQLAWETTGALLVIGNPPWVTNAHLGRLGSQNLPQKVNLKRLKGIHARTGDANFDIAESIWLKLITELSVYTPTIALLCKISVARNVLQYAYDFGLPISQASIRKCNAKRWFGASVDACLFCLKVGQANVHYKAELYADIDANEPISSLGVVNGRLTGDVRRYHACANIDGECSLDWRQGIKHDAASVMELSCDPDGYLTNKAGQRVQVEPEYIYPLMKGTDVFKGLAPHRSVIVTQRSLGEDTARLQQVAPKLWAYLEANSNVLNNRKSSIYTNRPRFSLFGVGPYAFAPYKVVVSGLHKTPVFRLISANSDQRPVMLDDTCYFLPLQEVTMAALLVFVLNHEHCINFLTSTMFADAKRPITKKLLQRIQLDALINTIPTQTLRDGIETIVQQRGEPGYALRIDAGETLITQLLCAQR